MKKAFLKNFNILWTILYYSSIVNHILMLWWSRSIVFCMLSSIINEDMVHVHGYVREVNRLGEVVTVICYSVQVPGPLLFWLQSYLLERVQKPPPLGKQTSAFSSSCHLGRYAICRCIMYWKFYGLGNNTSGIEGLCHLYLLRFVLLELPFCNK